MTTVLIDDSTKNGRDLIEFLRKKNSVCILDKTEDSDWWTLISEKERQVIEDGLLDIEKKVTIPYDRIKERYAHWL
jgi:hypothetical protein